MPTFTPPVTDSVPADYVGGNDLFYPADPLLRRLWGRFRQPGRAPNVFKLVDGTYTTVQPYDSPPGSVIDTIYYGAHTVPVSQAEADALTAAGFGAGVTP